MRTLLTLASVLAIAGAAACKKDQPTPTLPSSAFDPTIEETEPADPVATAEPTEGEPFDEELGEEGLAEADEIFTGRTPGVPGRATLLVDPGSAEPMPVDEVVAVMTPTRGNKARGTIRFRDTGDGLEVVADVTGLPKGPLAYHVHVFGDCSAPDAESAGPHFNFQGSSFAPAEKIITGNLGELTPGAGGKATATETVAQATLQGKFSIVGRAVVIHEKGNDPAKTPDGGAGKRLACGVIGVASEPGATSEAPAPAATPPKPTPTPQE